VVLQHRSSTSIAELTRNHPIVPSLPAEGKQGWFQILTSHFVNKSRARCMTLATVNPNSAANTL
jgi:hypothetical protein